VFLYAFDIIELNGSLVGDPARANILAALMGGRALTAGTAGKVRNRAGSATFWSSKPSGHGHPPEAGHVVGLASGRR